MSLRLTTWRHSLEIYRRKGNVWSSVVSLARLSIGGRVWPARLGLVVEMQTLKIALFL